VVSMNLGRIACRRISFFDQSNRNWEKAWRDNNTPWETGKVTPGLAHAIENGFLGKRLGGCHNRAFVPGCGSGADVVYLHNSGIFSHVAGVDVSQTAIDAARKIHSQVLCQENKDESIQFIVEDVFSWIPDQPFDLIFDYLFFSALDIDLRLDWAKSMRRLLKKDTGVLTTLLFPVYNPEKDLPNSLTTGPPYSTTTDSYKKLLVPLGFSLIHEEDVPNSIKPRKGREKLAYWTII